VAGVPLQLSQTKPDFESLVVQLQLFLNSRATWNDLLTSSTGQTLIEMMAAVGTFNQFAVEVAAREGFLHTAVRESSIYAITRMLGVRINRKNPAGCDVRLSRGGDSAYPRLIPKFTQFTVNGQPFFNRNAIMFNAGATTADGKLFEGTVKTQTIPADSTSFREIYLNEPGFIVSNTDVQVELVNPSLNTSELWEVIDDGIWTAGPDDPVYYDATSGLGDTVLAFGDGHSGRLPSIGSNIVITYTTTNGRVGNNGGRGLEIQLSTAPDIQGVTTSVISGGADQKDSTYYKFLAPHLYKARKRAVNPPDYRAITSSYPGVASVTIQAQKDIAPKDLRWMNVIRICILPEEGEAFSDSEWESFLEWFGTKSHAAIKIQKFNPRKIVRDIDVTLALKANAMPEEVVPVVEANIRALFNRTTDTLGKRVSLYDIMDCATIDVDYMEIAEPMEDLVALDEDGKHDPLAYFELGTLSISARYTERAPSAMSRR
jgi:hypothetical protein